MTDSVPCTYNFGARRSFASTLFAVLFPLLVFVTVGGAAWFARLGYQFGYDWVNLLFGQPSSDQGTGADILAFKLIPAITVGMMLGYVEVARRQTWWRKLLVPLSFLSIYAPLIFIGLHDSSTHWETMDWQWDPKDWIAYCVGVLPVAYGANYLSRKLYPELRLRTRVIPLVCCVLVACCGVWALDPYWTRNYEYTFAIYCALLTVAGMCAPLAIRARDAAAGMSSAFFATLPVTIFDFVNVVFTVLFLFLNIFGVGLHLGWRATLSASMITAVSLLCTICGGFLGGNLSRFFHREDTAAVAPALLSADAVAEDEGATIHMSQKQHQTAI